LKKVFISADHGLAIVYFLQSDIASTLLEKGVEIILLTDDGLKEQITKRFGQSGLTIEGLRFKQANHYADSISPGEQYWLGFFRRAGASRHINTEAMDSYIKQVTFEATGKRRLLMPLMKALVQVLRRSRWARQQILHRQSRFSPELYTDLFEKYKPDLVVASTPGWRLDRYLLRQAVRRGVKTAAVVVGWDNPSSYSIPGAEVDWITCWSQIQKDELVNGSDWDARKVNINGIPSYDGYFRRQWVIRRDDYFHMHNLDPQRKLLSFACSFVSFSPNIQDIEPLARMVANDEFDAPAQLLVRLHPNHFWDEPLFRGEANRIRQLARNYPHVHVVEPVPLGGELGYYSGEDMPEKTSMMAHSDVFMTVYSTMVVETAIHDRPIISMCFDKPGGWGRKDKFSLALTEIGEWPTHQRFRHSGAGKVVFTEEQLLGEVNRYLRDPQADQQARHDFIYREVTFTDGSAGKRTGKFILDILDQN
jgi:hypothetical protein